MKTFLKVLTFILAMNLLTLSVIATTNTESVDNQVNNSELQAVFHYGYWVDYRKEYYSSDPATGFIIDNEGNIRCYIIPKELYTRSFDEINYVLNNDETITASVSMEELNKYKNLIPMINYYGSSYVDSDPFEISDVIPTYTLIDAYYNGVFYPIGGYDTYCYDENIRKINLWITEIKERLDKGETGRLEDLTNYTPNNMRGNTAANLAAGGYFTYENDVVYYTEKFDTSLKTGIYMQDADGNVTQIRDKSARQLHVVNGYIDYISGDSVWRVKNDGTERKCLFNLKKMQGYTEDMSLEFLYSVGHWLYTIIRTGEGENNTYYTIQIKTDTDKIQTSVYATSNIIPSLPVELNGRYFTVVGLSHNSLHIYDLFRCEEIEHSNEIIWSQEYQPIYYAENRIFYLNEKGKLSQALCVTNSLNELYNGYENEQPKTYNVECISAKAYQDKIFYINKKDGYLHRIKLNKEKGITSTKKLISEKIDSYAVSPGYVYYTVQGEEGVKCVKIS